MSKVEIKIEIDPMDQVQVVALTALLNAIGGNGELKAPQVANQKEEKIPPHKQKPSATSTVTETAASKPAATKPAATKPAPKKEVIKKEEEGTEGESISIDEIRGLLSKKVSNFRTEIKSKLTEFGANNVTSLPEEKYSDFYEFLNSLE